MLLGRAPIGGGENSQPGLAVPSRSSNRMPGSSSEPRRQLVLDARRDVVLAVAVQERVPLFARRIVMKDARIAKERDLTGGTDPRPKRGSVVRDLVDIALPAQPRDQGWVGKRSCWDICRAVICRITGQIPGRSRAAWTFRSRCFCHDRACRRAPGSRVRVDPDTRSKSSFRQSSSAPIDSAVTGAPCTKRWLPTTVPKTRPGPIRKTPTSCGAPPVSGSLPARRPSTNAP